MTKGIRVVAGSAKGRRLAAPPGGVTRPTPNRVREAVFNSLYSLGAIEGARVLDLFAGTGALGIEALSRGAAEAVFVERDPAAAAVLRANLDATGLAGGAAVIVADVDEALDELGLGGRAGRRANPVHTGEAVARAARERSEQERETPRLDAAGLHRPRQLPVRFDVALVDPPYSFDAWPELLSRVRAELVVAESDRPVDVGPRFAIHHRRRHGGTVVTFAQAAERPSG